MFNFRNMLITFLSFSGILAGGKVFFLKQKEYNDPQNRELETADSNLSKI